MSIAARSQDTVCPFCHKPLAKVETQAAPAPLPQPVTIAPFPVQNAPTYSDYAPGYYPAAPQVTAQPDVPGIIGLVCGGIAAGCIFLSLCFGPLALVSLVLATGGLITSFFAQKGMKVAGICLNSIVLAVTLLFVIVIALFFAFVISNAPKQPAQYRSGGQISASVWPNACDTPAMEMNRKLSHVV